MQGNLETLVGRTLGMCTLEKLIGHGGMGAVYLARQERPSRRVAVKVLIPGISARDNTVYQSFLARFRREADVIAKLEHINIIPIYEYGEQDGIAYLVMPYLAGGSLDDVLRKQGSLTPLATLTYLDQAASALDYAHGQGVVHRDLKPANFLLHADGRLMLGDFGIARILEESTLGATLTATGVMVGTPEYMAPEMASGELIDARADIYELGIVLFKMLSGHVPFSGGTPLSVAVKHLQEPLPSLHQQKPDLPIEVDEVVQRATAKNRSERYASARELVQALYAALNSIIRAQVPVRDQLEQQENVATVVTPLPLLASHTTNEPSHTPSIPSPYRGHTGDPTTAWSPASSDGVRVPAPSPDNYTPAPAMARPLMERPKRRGRFGLWAVLIALLLVLLVGAGIFATTTSSRNGQQPVHTTPRASNTPPNHTAQATAGSTPTVPPSTPTASAQLPASTPLYSTALPGAICDTSGGQWTPYNGVTYTCSSTQTQIQNTSQTQNLQGLFLTALPNGNYPDNYIVAAQFQQDASSNGDFGLYFRNQPGDQQGAYTLLIQHDGSWAIYVYDNVSGAPSMLAQGTFSADLHASLKLAVAVAGSQISVYCNGQLLQSITDTTYSVGTVGIAVSRGATVGVQSFSLSTLK